MTSPPPAVPPGWAVLPTPSMLAPAAIRLPPATPAVAFAFVPAEQDAAYLSTTPDRAAEFAEGHRAYRVAVQQHVGELLRILRGGGDDPQPYVVAIRVLAFTRWCARTGNDSQNPLARAAYQHGRWLDDFPV